MKNLMFTGLLLALITSCGSSKENKPTVSEGMPLAPEIFEGNLSEWIYSPDKKDSVESTMNYQFFSNPKLPWQDAANRKIAAFCWSLTEFDLDLFVYKPVTHDFFFERMQLFKKLSDEANAETDYPMIYSLDANCLIDQSISEFCQISLNAYTFTGGAHPNGMTIYAIISKETGEQLQLNDIFSDVSAFDKIAEKKFRESREISPTADLEAEGFWFSDGKFASNSNFSISKTGFHFLFNPYEIGPYAMGATEYFIPMNEVKHLLSVKMTLN
jgi:hypothetical protein